ncbi:MAG: hypothetical protein Q4E69_05435 [Bacilli bacterium]|nr:hypothetical protein [Bacilli bacterium]
MNDSIRNEKKYQRKHREIYLVVLLLLFISVGFSYLTTQLDIIGNTSISKQSWNVYFSNPSVNQTAIITGTSDRLVKDRGSVNIRNNSNNLIVDFNATLEYPGDYYEFTVPIYNKGTIDAMIAESGITSTYTNNDLVIYTIEYADGTGSSKVISEKDGLHAKKKIFIKVRVEYKKDVTNDQVNNMASGGVNISSSYSINYVQADNTANYKSFESSIGPHSGD